MRKNTAITSLESWTDYDSDPKFEVGDFNLVGTLNRYDTIAKKKNAPYFTDVTECVSPIPSSLTRISVVKVEKLWRPKNNRPGSWLTHGDYSGDPNFEQYWQVEFDHGELWYELADLLE